eukprot:PhF_6_TR31177/c0_g1_i1/m.45709/K01556/KYNU, kynU; kynureninase
MEELSSLALANGIKSLMDEALPSALDRIDPLFDLRGQYHIPLHEGIPVAYMCGNSLGLQHVGVSSAVNAELEKWRTQAVEGHFMQPNPWFEIDNILRPAMASVAGAKPSEVVIMNTLTTNLHLMMAAFYQPEGKKCKVIVEANPFPSDMYAVRSHMNHRGINPDEHMVLVDSLTTEGILEAIHKHDGEIALVMIGAVHFLTGVYFDLQRIGEVCTTKNITFGVDAAHAIGNIELQLHDWNVDFACWCTYKYLNGGPGNIAGVFVHEKHHSSSSLASNSQLRGWWGHVRGNRFALKREFDGCPDAGSYQLSNPCVLSIMSLAPSLRLFGDVGMPALRKKSVLLTCYLETLIRAYVIHAVEILTPSNITARGCQLSLKIRPNSIKDKYKGEEINSYKCGNDLKNDADALQHLMKDQGVIVDNRPPDIIRISPVPMYTRFTDVRRVVRALQDIFKES